MPSIYSAVKAVIEHNGKYLLIGKFEDEKNYVDLPGGRLEYGESVKQALVREVKEELGVNATIKKPLGAWHFFRDDDKSQVICTTFLCSVDSMEFNLDVNPADEDIRWSKWLTKDELVSHPDLPDETLKELFLTL